MTEVITAENLFDTLVRGRQAERLVAQAVMCDKAAKFDRPALVQLIQQALATEYARVESEDGEDEFVADTRAWLLGSLGRLTGTDHRADKLLRSYLSQAREPNPWNRCWALEGLLVGKADDLTDVATLALNDPDEKVQHMGLAILASSGSHDHLTRVVRLVDEGVESMLRALRQVEIAPVIPKLCGMLSGDDGRCYAAVRALARVSPSSQHAGRAAHALMGFLRDHRRFVLWDYIRMHALKALGSLRVPESALTIAEDITDDNPGIVREAAMALDVVCGTPHAVARVVEGVAAAPERQLNRFVDALRWMNRDKVVNELETIMVSGRLEHQEVARKLLGEIGGLAAFQRLRARTQLGKEYLEVLRNTTDRVHELFKNSTSNAESGFTVVRWMDAAVFVVGLVLLAASAAVSLLREGSLASWGGVGLAGGLGVMGVLYSTVIADPRKKIQKSIEHLTRVNAVFLGYLRQLHQCDQAFTRRLLDDRPITESDLNTFVNAIERSLNGACARLTEGDGPPAIPPAVSTRRPYSADAAPNEMPPGAADHVVEPKPAAVRPVGAGVIP